MRQGSELSQTFLRKQTYLLKGLLKDKGGDGVANCKAAVIRRWLAEQTDAESWVESQFKALMQTYECLLSDPRPANLKRVKVKGKAPQLVWRVPNENGNHVVLPLFDPARQECREILIRLPKPVLLALAQIESWRVTLNYLSTLHVWTTESASALLIELETLRNVRQSYAD